MKAEPLGTEKGELGECPIWDAGTGRLFWLDILGERMLETDPETGATKAVTLPRRVNSVVPRTGGGWLASGLLVVDRLDGKPLVTLPEGTPGRFNDGKCDAAGRLWVGTATAEGHFDCALWCIRPDGSATAVVPGIGMSNGLGWSPDGATFYHADSASRQVRAYDFDLDAGTLSNGRVFYETAEGSVPDGLCVDASGDVWLAVWGGGRVLCLSPEGYERARIELPTPRVSSCAFGGPDMQTLFITTACEGASDAERAADPMMGRLFTLRPGATGLPVHTFAG